MIYNSGTGENRNWILKEERLDTEFPEKGESIMCLGNGYLGLRSAMEDFVGERTSRGLYVAGTFDFLPDTDATELPNSADVTNMEITVDSETVSPTGKMTDFERTLNFKNGLLTRRYTWESSKGKKLTLEFLRMVSLVDLHLICAKVNITCDSDCEVIINSGIDGNVKGGEHFEPLGINAVSDVLCLTTRTKQSNILFSTMTTHRFELDGISLPCDISVVSESENEIKAGVAFSLKAGQKLTVTKTSNVFTNRDWELDGCDMAHLVSTARSHIKAVKEKSFEEHLAESADYWYKKVWSYRDVKVECDERPDALAVRFAIYHLTIMAPVHDERMNIGAKGLSGPGYRGHAFWDTEIFMLPYFTFTNQREAQSLLKYRYNCLEAARKNAKDRGFEGAMYPWEAAWITDGETTPSWCLTGLMEYHITADVAAAIYNYYVVTGDEAFMENYGYEMLFETAKFWASKIEWIEENGRYEILHVIGPNEYKEDVNNNAFTNYLARYNILLAIKYAEKLKAEKPEIYSRLDKTVDLERMYATWSDVVDKIYQPRENEEGLVPEDDTFLTLPDICPEGMTISQMVHEAHKIASEQYNGVNNVRVGKQADVMLLMYLFEDLFTADIKKKNFYYYERLCFHDSSLSLSTYSTLAADLKEKETAYALFERASMIDMGQEMWTSIEGIHAASLGGIWQCATMGFGGVRRYGEKLRIEPNLPDEWTSVDFNITWKGQMLNINVNHNALKVTNLTATTPVTFINGSKEYTLTDSVTIDL